MEVKRIAEVIGLAMLGEGIIGIFAPKKYSLLWEIGPEPIRDIMRKAAENPEKARLIYAAEAGLGLCLAISQVKHASKKIKD